MTLSAPKIHLLKRVSYGGLGDHLGVACHATWAVPSSSPALFVNRLERGKGPECATACAFQHVPKAHRCPDCETVWFTDAALAASLAAKGDAPVLDTAKRIGACLGKYGEPCRTHSGFIIQGNGVCAASKGAA